MERIIRDRVLTIMAFIVVLVGLFIGATSVSYAALNGVGVCIGETTTDSYQALVNGNFSAQSSDTSIVSVACSSTGLVVSDRVYYTFSVDYYGVSKGSATVTLLINGMEAGTVEVTVSDHVWANGEITKKATCTEEGVKTYHCMWPGCHGKRTERIEKLNHDYQHEILEPEIGIAGKERDVCSRCGDEINMIVLPMLVPEKTSITKLNSKNNTITVKWAKKPYTGYQVRYSVKSSMSNSNTVNVSSSSSTTKTIKKLKAGKKYYVQVRTYKTVDGDKIYSDWSGKKSVKTGKSTSKAKTSKKSSSGSGKVYWTPSGSVYHVSRNCPTLKRSKTVYSGSASSSGRRKCKVCG